MCRCCQDRKFGLRIRVFNDKIASMIVHRTDYLERITTSITRAPVTTLLGPRQCGKTTLARFFSAEREATYFDLESLPDQRRLQNPELMLGSLKGLVILDEIQIMPELFSACSNGALVR